MEKNSVVGLGVRRGAWAKEEDDLLRNCVETYGEGKWHLVPIRAGLNRCRKSCRLRWLNYLRPNLKRGTFNQDEVDLVVRLLNLLGNRWSLIDGRIPGRTGNDIKNFWNTHFDRLKRPSSSTTTASTAGESSSRAAIRTITQSNIIRPQPRTFSGKWQNDKHLLMTRTKETNDDENENLKINKYPSSSLLPDDLSLWLEGGPTNDRNWINIDEDNQNDHKKDPLIILSSSPSQDQEDECVRWWGDLLEMTEKDHGATPLLFSDDPIIDDKNCATDDGPSSDLCIDVDVWDFLSSHDH